MTIDAYAAFSPCLRYRSPGNAPPWDDGCAFYFYTALEEIPDADMPGLMKAVMTGECGKFRPDPVEILELWRSQKVVTPPEYYYDAKCNVFRPVPAPAVQHYLTGGDDN